MPNEILKKLGFNDKEVEIYTAILKHGKIAPADLAQATGINRTTVYSVSKELIKKGVITEDLGGNVRYFLASPLESLNQIAADAEKKVREKKDLIGTAIKELGILAGKAKYAVPKIVFISEDDLENYLYKQTPAWNKSMMESDGIWWGFQDSNIVRYYEKWIDWYWESGSPKDIRLKLISNEEGENLKEKQFARRQVRFWDGAKDFTATVWVMGDFVVMLVTNQSPQYLVEINDSILAHNLRLVFKGIWKDLK